MAPACTSAWSAGATLLLMIVAPGSWLSADEQPAGPAELDALAQQIVVMHRALAESQAQLDAEQAQERDFLLQTAQQLLRDWHDPTPAPEPALDDFPAWYLEQWRRHGGFAPLQPLSGWQRSWLELRAAVRPLYDRYEELAVACHRLERLRDRLRRQLQSGP